MWGRRSNVFILLLCILTPVTAASGQTLVKSLNTLSQHYHVPVVYTASLLEGLFVTSSVDTTLTMEEAFNAVLIPHSLDWKKTSSGILIFRADHVPEKEQLNPTVEELTVVGRTLRNTPDNYRLDYEQAAAYARQLKQKATGETDYVVGAMLTRLPAENLAEALVAIPGLTVTRDRGEALNISAMGLGAEYQLTLLNGRRLANTENVRNSNQYGQQYRFDTLSAGLFNNVELHKTANVTLPSGAAGAVINLLGDDPLAYNQSAIDIALAAASLQRERNFQPGFSLNTNGVSDDGKLGVVARMHYENRLQRQFQYETWHWGENAGAPTSYHWPDLEDQVLVPTDGLALTIENEDRTRTTYYTDIAWAPADTLRLNATWFLSDTDFTFDEHRLSINPLSHRAQAEVASNNSLTNLRFAEANAKVTREESVLNYNNQTLQFDVQLQPFRNTSFQSNPFYSRSKAKSITLEPISRVHVGLKPASAKVATKHHTLEQFDINSNLAVVDSYSHISQMSKRTINVVNQVDEWGVNSTWLGQADSFLDQVQTGMLKSQQRHQYARQDVRLMQAGLDALPPLDGRWLMPLPNKFAAGFVGQEVQRWLIPKSDLFQLYEISLPFGEYSHSDRLNSYAVTFEAKEVFLNTHWTVPEFSLEAGARYSHTQSSTEGAGVAPEGIDAFASNTSSDAWLPQIKVMWQPTGYWQWRASASRALNRPNYSDLNPKMHVNSAGLPYAEAGNPALKPVKSNTTTLSVTYLHPSLSVQVLGFNHNLDNFIIDEAHILTFDEKRYSTLIRTNNSQASISGFQVGSDWQLPIRRAWLKSSQLAATFTTVTAAEVTIRENEILDVEGVSEWAGNLRLMFDAGTWQGAINVNHRSGFLEQRDLSNNADVHIEAFTGVDISLSWLYSENADLRLDVYNATNEILTRTSKTETASSLMKAEEFGRRFLLSLTLTL